MAERMEGIEQLVGAYFHQDWVMDGGKVSDTVRAFLSEPRRLVVATVDEIDTLLDEPMPEGALEAQLDEWGCQYYAGDTDDDYRRWLAEIRDDLSAFLATGSS